MKCGFFIGFMVIACQVSDVTDYVDTDSLLWSAIHGV